MVDLKKILLKLLQCNHVIDYGTSGAWTYRKWSDGTVEAWATFVESNQAGSVWASPIYYYDAPAKSFPTNLFSSAPRVYITSQSSQWWTSAMNVTATAVRARCVKPTSGSQALSYSIYAVSAE